MPNHVLNRLDIKANNIDEIHKAIMGTEEDDEGKVALIDFNRIVPMPEELEITEGSLGSTAYSLLMGKSDDMFVDIEEQRKRFMKMDKEEMRTECNHAINYIDNEKKHGHRSWYSWCNANWGTKWNAYSHDYERSTDNVLFFETAWAPPVPVIQKLSEMFPEATFLLAFDDEQIGYLCGAVSIQNGDIKYIQNPEPESFEAYELAFFLRPDRRDDFELVGNKYQYKNA